MLAAMLLAMSLAAACSDRVPAPVTPTPTPRPGYPPAPSSELPEGVLYVQQPSSGPPLLFGIGADGEPKAYERGVISGASPDGSKAVLVAMQESTATREWLPTGLGLLIGEGYEPFAETPSVAGFPMVIR